MTRAHVLKIINVAFPAIGVGLIIFYGVCDTSCSSLQGTFLGLDLKVIGILYMAALLALSLPPASRWAASVHHLRTMLLSGALPWAGKFFSSGSRSFMIPTVPSA